MNAPYSECSKCIATHWCKLFNGKAESTHTNWCRAKYRLDKALALTGIPKRYINANAWNYQLDEVNKPVYDKLKPYLLNIVDEVDKGFNFYLYHNKPGTGKTYHASMLLNHFVYKSCLSRFDFENPLALFVTYADYIHDLRYNRDDDRVEQLVAQVKDVPILLLDDFGAGTITDFVNEQVYILLNHRFNQGLSTIITSNVSLAKLAEKIDGRIISRITNNCEIVVVDGKDRRLDTVRGK